MAVLYLASHLQWSSSLCPPSAEMIGMVRWPAVHKGSFYLIGSSIAHLLQQTFGQRPWLHSYMQTSENKSLITTLPLCSDPHSSHPKHWKLFCVQLCRLQKHSSFSYALFSYHLHSGCASMCVCVCALAHVCVHAYLQVCVKECPLVCLCAYRRVQVCAHLSVCVEQKSTSGVVPQGLSILFWESHHTG